MTGDQAIEYLYSRLKFGSIPGLERIKALCQLLGNPQDKLKFIHVAGTNGKGSTCTMISNMLISANYKTGLFTSPYIIDFRERMQINGQMISAGELGSLMEEVKPKVDQLDKSSVTPTEFEVLTALAFLYFYKNNCDVVVLEVGLGGLCDSTNIINPPDVCVITSVSYDHTNILGETIEEIAYQKSGIIKKGSALAVYPQPFNKAKEIIINTARENNCKVFLADTSLIKVDSSDFSGSCFSYKNQKIKTALIGEHQILNAATAYEAGLAMQSKGYKLDQADILFGIANSKIPARMQIISKNPLIVLDGGHNPDGISALCNNLNKLFGNFEITAIIGMMKDKNVDDSIKMIAPLCKKIIAVTVDNPRSMSSSQLKEKIEPYCENVFTSEKASEAFKGARASLKSNEMLLVCGSLYLASEIKNME